VHLVPEVVPGNATEASAMGRPDGGMYSRRRLFCRLTVERVAQGWRKIEAVRAPRSPLAHPKAGRLPKSGLRNPCGPIGQPQKSGVVKVLL
jgi:hypothetical protein